MNTKLKRLKAEPARRFLAAVENQGAVSGHTHSFYRYPARFSPEFARAAIEVFSRPGDVILDPFMGGATTLVEASTLGRHSLGSDISSLSNFLAQVKTTPLSERDLERVKRWLYDLLEQLSLHNPPCRAVEWQEAGYQRNLPWPVRKALELALARVEELPNVRQQRFARCLLLKAGQWAVDCRAQIPRAEEFRARLSEFLEACIEGMREYRRAVECNPPPDRVRTLTIGIRTAATELPNRKELSALPKKPSLVVTSPPYPGVHVLYHRWNVRGRRESPAPFWIADCQDGHGGSHYTLGDRKEKGLKTYFNGIRDSFAAVRQVLDPTGLVVQLIAFSQPRWQIRRYLEAMHSAGFEEIEAKALGIQTGRRLSRRVPGRRWFALIQGSLGSAKELVLFHRPLPN